MVDISIELAETLRPPMANGEVLFDAPWQGRVFGMAVALHEAGVFIWDEFQQSLIRTIGEWDMQSQSSSDNGEPYEYYQHFANALDQLMADKGLVSLDELEAKTTEFAARPHGHDH